MPIADVNDWIEEYARPRFVWYAKRLAANDTLATHAHQAGPYVPKDFLFRVLPSLNQSDAENPEVRFDLYIDSHADHRLARAVWYNNRLYGGTRNETRITNLGGAQSALLDPDSTGTLAVFAFRTTGSLPTSDCHVWVCGGEGIEADVFEERLGPIEPKQHVVWTPGELAPQSDLFAPAPRRTNDSCRLEAAEIPADWLLKFPTGEEIIQRTLARRPPSGMNPDVRLMRRRQCEYEMFLSVEEATYRPRIAGGFADLQGFLSLAQTVLQSRKTRSGNSLELHAREIFREEGLESGRSFSFRPVIEGGKRPDFIFPSKAAYDDPAYPSSRFRMLGAKTTCKDRWRQVLNEANRVQSKHLLTLQEGVSEGQFREMNESGVQLVVPKSLHRSYPSEVQPHLVSFESFIGDVRLLQL
jgi:hypothetical protein